jgi:hypothetical protein
VIAALLVLALARGPENSPSVDNPHFAAAVEAWEARRWPDAAEAFARAYAIEPRPQYVFARAQALRLAGDCTGAIAAYRAFIDLAPPPGAIDEARGFIVACGGDPTPPPPVAPRTIASPDGGASPDDGAPRPSDPPLPAAPPRRRSWWRDPAGHAVGWTGLAIAAAGAGLTIEGLARRERGTRATDEQGYRDARRGGATMLHAGIPLTCVGTAMVLAAVIRFAVLGARGPKRARAMARALGLAGARSP